MSQNMPPDVPSLVRLGHAYSRRGEYLRAAEAFAGAIDLDPTDADLLFFRANAYAAAGKYDKAVADSLRRSTFARTTPLRTTTEPPLRSMLANSKRRSPISRVRSNFRPRIPIH